MRFMVTRTSAHGEKPCGEAALYSYVRVDERTVDDPAKVPAYSGRRDWWYREGRNHRVEDGHIMRDFDGEAWFVELESLDDLLAFIAKFGEVVVGPSGRNGSIMNIEIYDSHRQ